MRFSTTAAKFNFLNKLLYKNLNQQSTKIRKKLGGVFSAYEHLYILSDYIIMFNGNGIKLFKIYNNYIIYLGISFW